MCLCSCFGVCLFLLYCHPVITGQSNLICSSEPIVALAGDDVILPCRLEPPVSASSRAVEWTKPGLDPEYIHVHQDGRLVYQSQNPLYNYRTALFVDQLIHGNVSLKLFSVKISDAGKYKSFLPSLWKEAFIQLNVGAVSPPVVSLAGIDEATSGVVLHCESAGWYPEPEVFWLDGEGKLLSAGPPEAVRGPDGLYTVSSRVTVEERHGSSITCRVQQQRIKQIRETEIHVPGDFFMASSSCTVSIVVSIIACFIFALAVVFAVWKWRRNRTKNELNQEPKTEGEEKSTSKSNNTEVRSHTNKTTTETKPLVKPQTEQKKALNVASREQESTNTSSQDSQDIAANSHVIVEEVDLNGKFVCLRNKSRENKQMCNWKVDIDVNKTIISYKFPSILLEAGNTVKIWASDGGGNNNPPTDVVWKKQKSWGPADRLQVTLTSPMGEIMDKKTVSCP